jgi:hypothetical protein
VPLSIARNIKHQTSEAHFINKKEDSKNRETENWKEVGGERGGGNSSAALTKTRISIIHKYYHYNKHQ